MTNLQQEREHLVLADRHIVEGRRRVADQTKLVETMARNGQDTVMAARLLRTFEETLEAWLAHRRNILRALDGR
ncbi:hypothetical protein [Microvirga yunnanensis]|uniref:hypothetical protein n=1 Tax=Microvirga yunnanensis TaxID=2953740 RepID=UPI0021C95B22|nr:hypothetical protein [Microvirga sp. HBU65207]